MLQRADEQHRKRRQPHHRPRGGDREAQRPRRTARSAPAGAPLRRHRARWRRAPTAVALRTAGPRAARPASPTWESRAPRQRSPFPASDHCHFGLPGALLALTTEHTVARRKALHGIVAVHGSSPQSSSFVTVETKPGPPSLRNSVAAVTARCCGGGSESNAHRLLAGDVNRGATVSELASSIQHSSLGERRRRAKRGASVR